MNSKNYCNSYYSYQNYIANLNFILLNSKKAHFTIIFSIIIILLKNYFIIIIKINQ